MSRLSYSEHVLEDGKGTGIEALIGCSEAKELICMRLVTYGNYMTGYLQCACIGNSALVLREHNIIHGKGNIYRQLCTFDEKVRSSATHLTLL